MDIVRVIPPTHKKFSTHTHAHTPLSLTHTHTSLPQVVIGRGCLRYAPLTLRYVGALACPALQYTVLGALLGFVLLVTAVFAWVVRGRYRRRGRRLRRALMRAPWRQPELMEVRVWEGGVRVWEGGVRVWEGGVRACGRREVCVCGRGSLCE